MTGQNNNVALTKNTDGAAYDAAASTRVDHGFGARGWILIVFQAVMFWLAAGAVTHGLNVVLPALSSTYHLEYSALLALATPASWASIPAGPICAWLCEKKGARFNIVFCLLACGVCFGLLGYCGSLVGFTLLFAGVCFFGTGFAYVGGTAVMTSWFVRKAGLALGWCTVGQTMSSAFFVPTLAGLFALLGIRHGFWGIAIAMFVMALLVLLFVANKPEDVGLAPDNEPLSGAELAARAQQHDSYVCPLSVRQLLGMRDVWFMGIATGAIYIMLVGVVSQIVPRLMEMGYELNTAILYMTASALFGTFGAYGWGWLNHRLGVKRALLVYTLWWMAAVLINLFAHQPLMLWLSLLMIGFSLPGATNLSTALIATKFPRRLYVRAIGIVHPIQSIVRCFAFSILAFGLAYLGGYTGAYLLLVGVGAVALLLIWLIDVTPVSE
ncbi:MFS transporter [Musicola paradisiaca]|uniref:Major facilitator superfamily MFS_1 n=1 Tax=Musicola paradisiaca (strain Ech703) TaxID=579405 RepID=C6CDR1_MUSP7|nr:MFS transporter [Musicola paradisiaca]ACS85178.1 major facilitator superfamily MFS_1 [Musicola paradisiaca Ech703]